MTDNATAVSLKVEETGVDMSDVKPERSPSASVPPTPSTNDSEIKPSPSPAPTMESKCPSFASPSKRETPSRSSSTPTPKPDGKANGRPGPQLIGHLPRAEAEAMKTFVELKANHYQYSTLGRSREALESMTCDCTFTPGRDDPQMACGHGSDCINRLTQVECLEDDCRCRVYCKNQRMQRREYAHIEIVLTENKGYGLRAGSDIPKDAFIYEYIGDVVSQPSFVKRMRDYAEEGVRHFYFMMLQKDSFIDATKRGGVGRFANHSCDPNCYVAKWTVGQHVRMGIYAKRNIQKDEELTFNYNVDRYGHEAQPCYCGEPNCVGFLGGKTQTDVAAMDDLYLDALGISEEVEMYGLKGTKKKKGKKLDEDYVPELRSLLVNDIPKVVQAIRQTQSRKVLLKLLSRIKMTDDQPALRQLMRLRGYSLMRNILEDNLADVEVCTIAMEGLAQWPLLQRNKVEDSRIEEPVGQLAKHENETVSSLAKKLLEHWASLETGYRIPKRFKGDDDEISTPAVPEVITFDEPSYKRVRMGISALGDLGGPFVDKIYPKPFGKARVSAKEAARLGITQAQRQPQGNDSSKEKTPEIERERVEQRPKYWWEQLKVDPVKVKEDLQRKAEDQKSLLNATLKVPLPYGYRVDSPNKIIADAKRRAEEERRQEEERQAAEQARRDKEEEERQKRRERKEKERAARKKNMSHEEKEAYKEKKLQKLVGAVVVKYLSKYRDQLDRDTFKKRAKELTCLIAEKEKKSSSYQNNKLDTLSDEKVVKIKKFCKEYIAKLLRRMEKEKANGPSSSSHPKAVPSGSGSGEGRDPVDEGPGQEYEQEPMMSVGDALDLGPDSSDDDNDNDAEDDDEEKSGDPSPASDLNGRGPGPAVAVVGRDVDADDADMDVSMDMDTDAFASTTPSPLKRSRWDEPPPPVSMRS